MSERIEVSPLSIEAGARSWPWPDLDHSSAATLLADAMDLQGPGSLEPLGEGDFCLALRLGRRVVRVARHREAAAALAREACVLGAVASRLPLAVPRPVLHQPSECPPFSVHQEIVGDVLTREAWEGLPAGPRQRAASDLADFMRALHALPISLGGECGLATLEASAYARTLRDAAAVALDSRLDGETWRSLAQTLECWASPADDEARRFAILHCDLAPGHLLYDAASGRLTGVIDFGDVALGPEARDFIFIYEDFGPAILRAVLERYESPGEPPLMPEIRKWYLLEAVEWTVSMVAEKRESEVAEGLAEITRELADGDCDRYL